MAIFKYTLPSGATFQMTAPDGTTQADADKIFYEQVAAGTFVGYNTGDTLSHPADAIVNFGLSRLERGTAGVDNQEVLAVTTGLGALPTVVSLPSLSNVPVQNGITQTNYLQVTSSPSSGYFDQQPKEIGELSSVEVQAVMAQIIASVDQAPTEVTQEKGVGKFGFNSEQLERAGYIKPGFSQMYCPVDINTQKNPSNFTAFMNSPTPWTGLNGVNNVQVITNSEALQNRIQESLLTISYDAFVSVGMIKPSTAKNPPLISTGHVYTSSGAILAASVDTLLTTNIET